MDIIDKPLLWGLDPLFNTHARILIATLKHVVPAPWNDGGTMYFFTFVPGHPPRPIRLITVGGIVVFASHYQRFSRFVVDDGSATLRCFMWSDDRGRDTGASSIKLSDFIEVSGRLDWKDSRPLLMMDSFAVMNEPNAELNWWADVMLTYKCDYSKKINLGLISETEKKLTQSFQQANEGPSPSPPS